jgi:hypothetical protein
MSTANDALDSVYAAVVDRGGHPSTFGGGPIRDDAWNRSNFPYASALAEATGLDFVKLAAVEHGDGTYGVDQVLARLGGDEATAARRIQATHKFGDAWDDAGAERARAALDGDLLDALVRSFVFRSNADAPWSLTPESYPLSAKLAELSGLSFEKLATLETKGGTDALRVALRRLPDLPNREACLALL